MQLCTIWRRALRSELVSDQVRKMVARALATSRRGLLLLGLATAHAYTACGPGWSILNGKCAQRFGFAAADRLVWTEAEADCVARGAHLASVSEVRVLHTLTQTLALTLTIISTIHQDAELKALAAFCFEGVAQVASNDCALVRGRAR